MVHSPSSSNLFIVLAGLSALFGRDPTPSSIGKGSLEQFQQQVQVPNKQQNTVMVGFIKYGNVYYIYIYWYKYKYIYILCTVCGKCPPYGFGWKQIRNPHFTEGHVSVSFLTQVAVRWSKTATLIVVNSRHFEIQSNRYNALTPVLFGQFWWIPKYLSY